MDFGRNYLDAFSKVLYPKLSALKAFVVVEIGNIFEKYTSLKNIKIQSENVIIF